MILEEILFAQRRGSALKMVRRPAELCDASRPRKRAADVCAGWILAATPSTGCTAQQAHRVAQVLPAGIELGHDPEQPAAVREVTAAAQRQALSESRDGAGERAASWC